MKGKYAARAVNREAARDNELIAEQADRIAALKAELLQVREQLNREKAERGSVIVARSRELACQEIAEMKEELRAAYEEQDKLNHKTARWIVNYMIDMEKEHEGLKVIPYPDIRDFLTSLVGDAKTTYYLSMFGGGLESRSFRRRGNGGITALDEMIGRTYEEGQHRLVEKMSRSINARKASAAESSSPAG